MGMLFLLFLQLTRPANAMWLVLIQVCCACLSAALAAFGTGGMAEC
jgi:hypothetical protein